MYFEQICAVSQILSVISYVSLKSQCTKITRQTNSAVSAQDIYYVMRITLVELVQ